MNVWQSCRSVVSTYNYSWKAAWKEKVCIRTSLFFLFEADLVALKVERSDPMPVWHADIQLQDDLDIITGGTRTGERDLERFQPWRHFTMCGDVEHWRTHSYGAVHCTPAVEDLVTERGRRFSLKLLDWRYYWTSELNNMFSRRV